MRQADATLAERDAAKTIVQTFYDEFGWVKDEGGKFNDTTAFMVSSHVADSYIDTCNARVGAELRRGKYLLDAASGAIPLASYLPYSRDYDQRVCVDFSIRALHEARAKLPNGRGVFVLGDITCLPIRDGVIDDAISLHTLYHVPRDLQTQAVDELVRTLKPKGKLVVVYTWGASPIMRIIRRVVRPVAKPDGSQALPELYYSPQGKEWFAVLKSKYRASLKLFSSTDLEFNKAFLKDGFAGSLTKGLVLLTEALLGPFLARYGQYPLFVITKT
ncbi:MAG TPA: class I SAM-dependent methyltransferase [Phenylobacterium sp.]|nr:class I SAM-dependent methyltransferase [Phenylobacterium sp.]